MSLRHPPCLCPLLPVKTWLDFTARRSLLPSNFCFLLSQFQLLGGSVIVNVTACVTVCDGKCYGLNIRKCLIINECDGVTAKNSPSGLDQG